MVVARGQGPRDVHKPSQFLRGTLPNLAHSQRIKCSDEECRTLVHTGRDMSRIKKTTAVLAFTTAAVLLCMIMSSQLYNTLPHRTTRTNVGSSQKEAVRPRSTVSFNNQIIAKNPYIDHQFIANSPNDTRTRWLATERKGNGSLRTRTSTSDTHWTATGEPEKKTPPTSRYTLATPASVVKPQSPTLWKENPHCTIPPGGFKSWNQGVVTVLKPILQRNCSKLFAGDRNESERIKTESKSWKNSLSDTEFLQRTRNCSWLREELKNNLYNTALEQDFPMAYIFIINGRPQSVFRNLKLLFRPQNTFCINFDSKSSQEFKQIFKNVDRCFENIMISSKQENVIWGYYTIMEAQLNCHYDLLKYRESQPPSKQWKYVINLCGKELPLMSPHEIVRRLSILNGSASILPRKMTGRNVHDWERIQKKVKYSWWYSRPVKTDEDLESIPFNLTYYKSSSYSVLSHKFVRFMLTDPVGLEVHNYFTKSMHSEEHFYATLFMMSGVPGGYNPTLKDLYVRAAHSTWIFSANHKLCQGTVVNSICIITAGDLPMVMGTSENRTLFHNKYFMNHDHTAMDCLEEMIVKKNKLEYERDCLR